MIHEAGLLGIKAGDWLQAGATIFAVMGTILGTLHIERSSRDASSQEDINRIAEVVTAIRDAAAAIRAGLPEDPTNYSHYAQSLRMQTDLKTSIDMYQFVRADTKIKKLSSWRALRDFDETLNNDGKIVDNELQIFNHNGHHTNVFNINRSKVTAASGPIESSAKAVLESL